MTNTTFDGLGLIEPLRLALKAENYLKPTPIQVQTIPLLAEGKDLFGIAETGTGKTAAFALPILQRLSLQRLPRTPGSPHALILAPTRELASQIAERFAAYGRRLPLRTVVIFGGVNQHHQLKALKAGVDILIATPGRLLDLCNQRHIRLDKVSILVLDEADRMLDMGFIHDVRKIVSKCRRDRQTLLFSATMPPPIAKLAADILDHPVRIDIAPPKVAVDRIEQRVFFVGAKEKRTLLESLLSDRRMDRVLVFTRTKRGADRVCRNLTQAGIATAALHGNKAQNARVRALDAFRNGKVRILVATDIAARGIDVPNISHVINYELPNEPESYVHRIGRTARAGAEGSALSFCDQTERPYLQAIERLMRSTVSVGEHRLAVTPATPATPPVPHKPRPHGKAPAPGKRRRRPNGRGFAGLPRAAQPSSRGERAHPLRGDLR
ncbi:DEAD/DEAH box helicase [Methyloceanibacter sp.]|uniref:DEAD/DEAH box helicase n=1 Tax=Methyloceanibacter sp. TaxID=1965321 RepID=UPI003C78FF48